jgi:hypothetical protein
VPCNPEEIEGMNVPKPDTLQSCNNFMRDQAWVSLLFEGWNNDISLSCPLYGPFEGFGINGQIDHGLVLLLFRYQKP